MRVLVFAPDHGGHYLNHVRLIALALLEISQEVTVALPAVAQQSAEFAAHLSDLVGRVRFDAWIPPLPGGVMKNAMHRIWALRQSIPRVDPEWLYVPAADSIGPLLGIRRMLMLPTLPRGLPAESLMLSAGFLYPQPNLSRKLRLIASWKAACLAPWTVMHVHDPLAYERVNQRGGALAARCRLMPDPVELPASTERHAARERLGIPIEGRYVACVGLIDHRKGADLLIRAFADCDAAGTLGSQDRLLLAGRQDPEIKKMLAGPYAELAARGRVVSLDRTLLSHEFLDGFTAADLVAALYPHHHASASMAIRAAAAQRPVLAHNFGQLGSMVSKFDLGWLCNATDPQELRRALVDALNHAGRFKTTEIARRFLAFHSVENFQAHWTAAIRRSLNLGPGHGLRSWDWVEEGTNAAEVAQIRLGA